MSEPRHLKCSCEKCGAHIEFPADGIGVTVDCPHCGQKTTLYADDPGIAVTSSGKSTLKTPKKLPAVVVSVLLVIILAGAGVALYRPKIKARPPAEPAATKPAVTPPKTNLPP